MSDRGELARRVRQRLQDLEMTQDQFVRESGVSKSHLQQVLAGDIKTLRSDMLLTYARSLGVTMDFLVTGEWAPNLEEMPSEVYLRQSSRLTPDNAAVVARIIAALQREQRAELEGVDGEPSGV